MKTKTVWSGDYRNISWEINQFEIGGKPAWAFYLYIKLDQIPEDIRERFWLSGERMELGGKPSRHIMYRYENEPFISELCWHGGCTWYSKHDHDGQRRVVQIGCDYQHYFDEGQYYSVDSILGEVQECVDSLYEMIPNIMRWCNYCGEYFDPIGDENRCPECVDK